MFADQQENIEVLFQLNREQLFQINDYQVVRKYSLNNWRI
jgi:hypothetical protein